MQQQILVPLDGSGAAAAILPEAALLAQAAGYGLILLHVVAAVPTMPDRQAESAWLDGALATRHAQAYLDAIAAGLRAGGLNVRTLVRQGDAAECILAAAGELGCCLIALTTRGRSGQARANTGRVATRVLRDTPLPLLLVQPQRGMNAPATGLT